MTNGAVLASVLVLSMLGAGCESTSHTASPSSPTPTRSAQSPSASPSAPSSALHGLVLGLDRESRFVRAELSTPAGARRLTLRGIPGGPSLIASDPGAGWIVTFTPATRPTYNEAPTRLAVVDPSGSFRAFGPTYPGSLPITALAVSPNARSVAFAVLHATGGGPAQIVVAPTPVGAGPIRTWTVDDPVVNEIVDLSWAPDGRHVSYIAGVQTGGGISGNPAMLDIDTTGRTAPTRSHWASEPNCDTDGAGWLGTTGRYAIVRTCNGATSYLEVNPGTGAGATAPLELPHAGCGLAQIHPLADARKILISRCDRVQEISQGAARYADADLVDAVWAGSMSPPPPGMTAGAPLRLRPGDPAVYATALAALQDYLDKWKARPSSGLTEARVVAYSPNQWTSPNRFTLLVTENLQLSNEPSGNSGNGLNDRFATFTRNRSDAPFQVTLASGPDFDLRRASDRS